MVRVRFAPSPTGTLHIGGVRTALYNFLYARQQKGTFILRIEDTDRTRYDEGAEDYIFEALKWLEMTPDEGPGIGGEYGPYRQSERKEAGLYQQYADQLIASGWGYYAFDTEEDLDALRKTAEAEGKNFKYDATSRMTLKNSLTLTAEEVAARLASGEHYVIRLKVPANETVEFNDMVREHVSYQTNELDDKVMLKGDGMPTYHFANVIDDHLMAITHVIRGEEWVPSTPTHVLLYRAFGWTAPTFIHLPLILNPNGKGKLSKRKGMELGIPVFPLGRTVNGETYMGFRESGFLPEATLNFLALLGWHGEGDQEIYTREGLIEAFDLTRIVKSGARFDMDKAKWFNQQYILAADNARLIADVKPILAANGYTPSDEFMAAFIPLFKERATFVSDFWEKGYYLFEDVKAYDEADLQKKVLKKWDAARAEQFKTFNAQLEALTDFNADTIKAATEAFSAESGLGFGDLMPVMRMAVSGTLQGPPVFDIMALLGKAETTKRMASFIAFCG